MSTFIQTILPDLNSGKAESKLIFKLFSLFEFDEVFMELFSKRELRTFVDMVYLMQII